MRASWPNTHGYEKKRTLREILMKFLSVHDPLLPSIVSVDYNVLFVLFCIQFDWPFSLECVLWKPEGLHYVVGNNIFVHLKLYTASCFRSNNSVRVWNGNVASYISITFTFLGRSKSGRSTSEPETGKFTWLLLWGWREVACCRIYAQWNVSKTLISL